MTTTNDGAVGVELVKWAADEAAQSVVPGWGIAKRLLGRVAPRIDLDRLQQQWLLDAIPYLYGEMKRRFEALPDQRHAEMAPVVAELTAQTVVDLRRTADSQKRKLMVDVLVNGIDVDWNAADHRFMVQAIAVLTPEHIAILKKLSDGAASMAYYQEPLKRGLASQLCGWGFAMEYGGQGGFEILPLGRRFLQYVEGEPEER